MSHTTDEELPVLRRTKGDTDMDFRSDYTNSSAIAPLESAVLDYSDKIDEVLNPHRDTLEKITDPIKRVQYSNCLRAYEIHLNIPLFVIKNYCEIEYNAALNEQLYGVVSKDFEDFLNKILSDTF